MDRTTPVGPWIVTLDELGGAGQPELEMSLSVNGERRRQDNTRQMIFPVDELLDYLDARISLRPGDLVFTGSTHGVGLEDGRFLAPGDLVEVCIEGLGMLRNRIGPQRVLNGARSVGRLGRPDGE
jgi:2-keto-4-pentenoate hydratase/2-oxohepta-3-ene-1,7-dioic acid hydratase in catechol pathway